MTPPVFRWAGLAAVATLWSTLVTAALRTGFPVLGDRPLSWMAADEASAALFSGGLVVGALLLVLFHGDVRTRYRVGPWFSIALLGGLAGQVVAGLVPIEGEGLGHRVHTVAALILGASLPVLMGAFAFSQEPGRWRRVAFGLFWLEAAACVAGVALSRRSVAPLAEIVPAVCFHLWIVVVTLSGPSRAERGRPGGARPADLAAAAPIGSGARDVRAAEPGRP